MTATPGAPPAVLLEIAGLRRLPGESLAEFLIRAHAHAQLRKAAEHRRRYWWHDDDE